jgi:probable F420-dependent oxidoreductase
VSVGLGGDQTVFVAGPAGLTDVARADEWSGVARAVEDAGFGVLGLGDHFDGRQDPIALAAAITQWSTHLHVGTQVLVNDWRSPAVMCREVATLAALAPGRFRCGVGAGWRRSDYDIAGARFEPASVRIGRLDEAVRLLKRSWSEDVVEHSGEHYSVTNLVGRALLAGAPAPALVLGGGGQQMLALAGREADVVSINLALRAERPVPRSSTEVDRAGFERKLATVSDAASNRVTRPRLQVVVHHVVITRDRRSALHEVASSLEVSAADVASSPHVLVGTHEEITDQIVEFRDDYGIVEWAISVAAASQLAPVVATIRAGE